MEERLFVQRLAVQEVQTHLSDESPALGMNAKRMTSYRRPKPHMVLLAFRLNGNWFYCQFLCFLRCNGQVSFLRFVFLFLFGCRNVSWNQSCKLWWNDIKQRLPQLEIFSEVVTSVIWAKKRSGRAGRRSVTLTDRGSNCAEGKVFLSVEVFHVVVFVVRFYFWQLPLTFSSLVRKNSSLKPFPCDFN